MFNTWNGHITKLPIAIDFMALLSIPYSVCYAVIVIDELHYATIK